MRITVVGGVERNEHQLREIAEAAGHELGYHGGHMGGSGANALAELVARAQGLGGVFVWELSGGWRASQPVGQRDALLQSIGRTAP